MRGSNTKGGISRCHEIHMKTPNEHLGLNCACSRGAIHVHEPLGLTCWRRIAGPEAGWNQAVLIAQVGRQNREPYRVCRTAVDHAVTVEGINADAIKGGVIGKLVHGEVIGVRPQTEFRVITEK